MNHAGSARSVEAVAACHIGLSSFEEKDLASTLIGGVGSGKACIATTDDYNVGGELANCWGGSVSHVGLLSR